MTKRITVGLWAALVCAAMAQGGEERGPGVGVGTVAGYDSSTFHERYRGGELAVVILVGDGSTDLDLLVYDEAGDLVTSSANARDRESVSWTPPRTGWYRIVVRNYGAWSNRFTIMNN